ncbi:MAG: hypothetical protein Kow0020_09600 [Wenzhouxiangellaceae bacterium]
MALRGVQRATVDLAFLVLMGDLERVHPLLRLHGYQRVFHSDNVSHYRSERVDFGRIDFLHAFRSPSVAMLDRADRIDIGNGRALPVVATEDIIGLKVQAAVNDPERAEQDWLDIRLLLEASAACGSDIDWALIDDYLGIFDLHERRKTLKTWYEQAV